MTLTEAKALVNCDPLHVPHAQTWFDLGCGSGLFSEALHELLPAGGLIYAVDKQPTTFNNKNIHFLQLDFVKDPLLDVHADGILMANSLHYVKDKLLLLNKIKSNLKSTGVFLLVEYDTEASNPWVPYPISFQVASDLFRRLGFETAYKIAEMPSRFDNRKIYAAIFSRR